jgi:hypothetical protein
MLELTPHGLGSTLVDTEVLGQANLSGLRTSQNTENAHGNYKTVSGLRPLPTGTLEQS